MKWDATLYDNNHSFVFKYGEDLIHLLAPKTGERILDLGCGTGYLTNEIRKAGCEVIGIDSSESMIETARKNYPEITFEVKDGKNFQVTPSFDAVFSNAVLHWIPEKELATSTIYNHLNPGGRIVVEFGGKDNNKQMLAALKKSFEKRGKAADLSFDFWYYPSIGEYASVLERVGFRVVFAQHYDRQTPLEGPDGMKNWFKMFGKNFFAGLTEYETEDILNEVQNSLRQTHYIDGKWFADYKRIRVVAMKH